MNLLEQAKQIPHGISVISQWLGDGAQIVSQDEAQKRADTCVACPLNVAGSPFVGAAAAAIKQAIALKNRLKIRVNREHDLGYCEACGGCANKLKIWMPPGRVQLVTDEETFDKLDKNCWIRKEVP